MTRIIQLLVLIALAALIAKPSLAPEPVSLVAQTARVWLLGESPSWDSTRALWQERIEVVGSTLPWIKSWFDFVPKEPPTISSETLMDFFTHVLITRPGKKWEKIKEQATEPVVSQATEAADMVDDETVDLVDE